MARIIKMEKRDRGAGHWIHSTGMVWEDEAGRPGNYERELRLKKGDRRAYPGINSSPPGDDKKTGEFRPCHSDIVIPPACARAICGCIYGRYKEFKPGRRHQKDISQPRDWGDSDILRVLDNQRQDIPLAAEAASPIGAIEELVIIAKNGPSRRRWYQLSSGGEDDPSVATGPVLNGMMLSRCGLYTPWRMNCCIWCREDRLRRLCACAMPGGEQRKANLWTYAGQRRHGF